MGGSYLTPNVKLFNTAQKIARNTELSNKISYTLMLVVIFRLGTFIMLPGIDPTTFIAQSEGILARLDTLLGGSFKQASIFSLGIYPYITASIMVQLMGVSFPYFQRLQKEGAAGRQKLNEITRRAVLILAPIQALGYAINMRNAATLIPKYQFFILTVVLLTAGSMACLWLSERITDKGIGNGSSILITAGILSSLPIAIAKELKMLGSEKNFVFVAEIAILLLIIGIIVNFMQGVRKIPLQRALQVVQANRYYQGRREYLPIKMNAPGVMPIIAASILSSVPRLLAHALRNKSDIAASIASIMKDRYGWQYNLWLSMLIILSTFFYTAIFVNPVEISDNLRRENAFIPGVKPGKPTAKYISAILDRITLPGSIFLGLIAALPALAHQAGISAEFSGFFGGTSLIIIIGVMTELTDQISSHLFVSDYDSFIENKDIIS